VQSANGHISFSKSIAASGIENYFDVTLQVTEEDVVEQSAVDVVIVMDISNTMNSTHAGLTRATGCRTPASMTPDWPRRPL